MLSKIQINRLVHSRLLDSTQRRLTLLTGARQTGKTTSIRFCYPKLPYYNLDSIEYRIQLGEVSSFDWGSTVGNAILDEVQKLPQVLEKVKFAFDAGSIDYSVLLGSAQILLLKQIRESLAGRVFIYELWPLMLSELVHGESKKAMPKPLLFQALDEGDVSKIFSEQPPLLIGEDLRHRVDAENHVLQWGGMPGLLHLEKDSDRRDWLYSYNLSYLERDLADLSRLDDLDPFRKFHTLTALRSANLLSYSSLAKDAGISVPTARKYLEYLRISYQAFLLPPYSRNITSTAVKTPKVYWSDIGLMRQLTGFTNQTTGQIYENYVVSEVFKYIRTMNNTAEIFFYRTRSGLEVDCLLKTPKGVVGLEIKSSEQVTSKDTSPLRSLGAALGKEWLGGIVAYRGSKLSDLGDKIWAVPSWRLLS
jgi:Predicted ATPase (AAA+ superfamily)